MRSTLDIIIAVKESQPVTQEELRLALVVMSNVEHFISHTLTELIEAVQEGKPSAKLRAGFARDTMERMFQALKKDPNDWLGPGRQTLPARPNTASDIRRTRGCTTASRGTRAGMKSDRYQYQPWHIRAYRWARYKPAWWLTGLYWVAKWAITGCRMEPFERRVWGSRWAIAKWMMTCASSQGEMRMKRYWDLSEVIEQLKRGESCDVDPRWKVAIRRRLGIK